jgi:hypothetical protein
MFRVLMVILALEPAAGASLADDKPRFCGRVAGLKCGANEWCEFAYDDNGPYPDMGGICRPRPEVCTANFLPVCGDDGNSYGNECEAHRAGVDVMKPVGRPCPTYNKLDRAN